MEKLKKSLASGASWGGFSALATTLLQLAQIITLAQLLGPADFGIMAMAMVITTFMQTIADMGISSALIYRQDATPEQTNSLFVLNILVGVAALLVALMLTPACVWFFREPSLAEVMPLCSLCFIITPFGQTQMAVLQKALRFRAVAIAEVVSQIINLTVAITLAANGWRVFALVWALLASMLVRTSMLNLMARSLWTPRWAFRRDHLRGFLRFGLYQTASATVNFLISRMDVMLLGRLLGPTALGFYNFAYNLAMQPTSRINPIFTRVAFPVFSKVQDDLEKLKEGFFLVSRILMSINAPLLLGLASLMRETTGLIFEAKWQPAVDIVQLLAIVALFRAISNPVGSLLLARGRADLEFRWNLLVLALQVPAVWLGARMDGAAGVAGGLLAVQVILSALLYMILIRTTIGPCLWEYSRNLAGPILCALGMAGVLRLMPSVLHLPGHTIQILLKIALGVGVYFGLMFLTQRSFLREAVEMFRKRKTS